MLLRDESAIRRECVNGRRHHAQNAHDGGSGDVLYALTLSVRAYEGDDERLLLIHEHSPEPAS